ncbi:MAG: aldehyde dehydrogenase (NADP(+)) [Pirellulales bacterium]
MELHGKQLLGADTSTEGSQTFTATNPASGESLQPEFHEATDAEIDRAMHLSYGAFTPMARTTGAQRSALLEAVADSIMALGDVLLQRANAETGLPLARLTGERGRTVNQAKMFARLAKDGSWVDARIDRAQPDRQPLPKPDVRRMLYPLGPVAVFGASNFPLAFSVAGGDTVSALAAGCPVVVKAHPAHPGTSELVGRAIGEALQQTGLPRDAFCLVQGAGNAVGLGLVRHPLTRAVAFTGSLTAGRALFDASAGREVPIPVHAEMGSINPVFLLPGALAERADKIAEAYLESVTLGVGQFCTNPGVVVGLAGDGLDHFQEAVAKQAAQAAPGTMLHAGIRRGFESGVERFTSISGVKVLATGGTADSAKNEVGAVIFATDDLTFVAHPELSEELFGPASLIVRCTSPEKMAQIATRLSGHLTATLHGTARDLRDYRGLIEVLQRKVGRIVLGGFPTGVEVCESMHHGGPYPATTDSRFTSVGTAAILRFARPVCYQNFPDDALPEPLRDKNTYGIWRRVDGQLTRDDC